MVDEESECVAVTVYNYARGKGVIIGNTVAIPDPFVENVDFKFKDKVSCSFSLAALGASWAVTFALIFTVVVVQVDSSGDAAGHGCEREEADQGSSRFVLLDCCRYILLTSVNSPKISSV